MPTPRTRSNRLQRAAVRTTLVGDDSMPDTCPRCGWPCLGLTIPRAFDSPWAEHGGLCTQCCIEACDHYDEVGWPTPPWEAEPEPLPEVDQPHLLDPGEALPPEKLPRGRSKAGTAPRAPRRKMPGR